MAFRAQGVELEGEWQIVPHFFARGGYTYLDAAVQRSFSSDNLEGGSYNIASNFPHDRDRGLLAARWRAAVSRAPQTGYFGLTYTQGKWYAGLAGLSWASATTARTCWTQPSATACCCRTATCLAATSAASRRQLPRQPLADDLRRASTTC